MNLITFSLYHIFMFHCYFSFSSHNFSSLSIPPPSSFSSSSFVKRIHRKPCMLILEECAQASVYEDEEEDAASRTNGNVNNEIVYGENNSNDIRYHTGHAEVCDRVCMCVCDFVYEMMLHISVAFQHIKTHLIPPPAFTFSLRVHTPNLSLLLASLQKKKHKKNIKKKQYRQSLFFRVMDGVKEGYITYKINPPRNSARDGDDVYAHFRLPFENAGALVATSQGNEVRERERGC
jgi:hypothetical protein